MATLTYPPASEEAVAKKLLSAEGVHVSEFLRRQLTHAVKQSLAKAQKSGGRVTLLLKCVTFGNRCEAL